MLRAEIDRLTVRVQELTLESQANSAVIRQARNEKDALNEEINTLKARLAGNGKHHERVRSEMALRYPPRQRLTWVFF